MKKSEVYTLFAYINRYYSNFGGDDEKVASWAKLLADIPFDMARDNLEQYAALTPTWPPTIADLRKGKDHSTVYHDHLRADANQFIGDLNHYQRTAVPPSESVKERVRQFAERNAARRNQ
ncbi:hypothetical protein [Paenibacillus spongiae]|uniref:Replicative helicase inhibitor G39P N-terminal domain-containing protein n=1 Tax=Paenibacillus spongiae TaxID=2909671 RepID=A0ABY5S2R2_9BACL|nr:hypothetical protein [Paenibacillus spongiae]UVI28186.1 hypothetical protein L1F29_22380 [Paenibacillus spongiae]